MHAKIVEVEIEQVVRLDVGIENEGGGHLLLGKPIEEAANEHGFAGAHFASEKDQALTGANGVSELIAGGARLIGDKEETRIRVDLERIFAQTEEIEDCLGHSAAWGGGTRILG